MRGSVQLAVDLAGGLEAKAEGVEARVELALKERVDRAVAADGGHAGKLVRDDLDEEVGLDAAALAGRAGVARRTRSDHRGMVRVQVRVVADLDSVAKGRRQLLLHRSLNGHAGYRTREGPSGAGVVEVGVGVGVEAEAVAVEIQEDGRGVGGEVRSAPHSRDSTSRERRTVRKR